MVIGERCERVATVASPAGRGRRATIGATRLAVANLLIAAGTLLVSLKRPFEVLAGSEETGFAMALSVGLAVVFVGFLVAAGPPGAAGTHSATSPVASTSAGTFAGRLGSAVARPMPCRPWPRRLPLLTGSGPALEPRSSRRTTLPETPWGSWSTNSTLVGHL